MGRNNDKEDPVFTSTVRTSPSFPWITLTMRSKCHFPWEGLDPPQVLGLQLARFVEVCAIFVYPVGLEDTPSAIVSKNGQPISASVSISLSTAYLLSQRFQVGWCLLFAATKGRLVLMVEGRRGGLSETAQRGLDLRVASTSVRTVASTSSSTRLFSKHSFQGGSSATYQPFPYPTGMRSLRWLKHPLAPSLQEFISDLVLVPIFNCVSDLPLGTHKIGPIVRVHKFGWPSSIYKSCKDVNKTVSLEESGQL